MRLRGWLCRRCKAEIEALIGRSGLLLVHPLGPAVNQCSLEVRQDGPEPWISDGDFCREADIDNCGAPGGVELIQPAKYVRDIC